MTQVLPTVELNNPTRVIIAEKKSMGHDIAQAIPGPKSDHGSYIQTPWGRVTWVMGHVCDSLEPEEYDPALKSWSLDTLPFRFDNWRVKASTYPAKAARFKAVRDLVKGASEVINAGDPGREGQIIVDELLTLTRYKGPCYRLWLESLEKSSVLKAFAELKNNADYAPLYHAGVCRSYADAVLGYNMTRLLTLLARKKGYTSTLLVGRIKTPVLSMVVERDRIIETFKPSDYFTIHADYIPVGGGMSEKLRLQWAASESTPASALDADGRLVDASFAAKVLAECAPQTQGVVTKYEPVQVLEHAPLPFSLPALQMLMGRKFGMSPKETLEACQGLYEKHKVQSYPRTDAVNYPSALHPRAAEILKHLGSSEMRAVDAAIYAGAVAADASRLSGAFNDAKLEGQDHHALAPTTSPAPWSSFSKHERQVYLEVCRRFVAQFLPPATVNKVSMTLAAPVSATEDKRHIFKASGRQVVNPGWMVLFDKVAQGEEVTLPLFKLGDVMTCKFIQSPLSQTKPPDRFSRHSLLHAMTNVHTTVKDPVQKKRLQSIQGLGRPATRDTIIEELITKGLLLPAAGGFLVSSGAARQMVAALSPQLKDPVMTALWEEALNNVAMKKMTPEAFNAKMDEFVKGMVLDMKAKGLAWNNVAAVAPVVVAPRAPIKRAVVPKAASARSSGVKASSPAPRKGKDTTTPRTCPKCGSALALKSSFFGCSSYPACRHTENI